MASPVSSDPLVGRSSSSGTGLVRQHLRQRESWLLGALTNAEQHTPLHDEVGDFHQGDVQHSKQSRLDPKAEALDQARVSSVHGSKDKRPRGIYANRA